jgi:hypothetical protein
MRGTVPLVRPSAPAVFRREPGAPTGAATAPLTAPATELADVPVPLTVLDGDPTHRAARL